MIFLLQRKPQLGRTKPSTGPHAGRGLDIFDKVRVESKTIHTADVNASATLPWWCQWRNKPAFYLNCVMCGGLQPLPLGLGLGFTFRFGV